MAHLTCIFTKNSYNIDSAQDLSALKGDSKEIYKINYLSRFVRPLNGIFASTIPRGAISWITPLATAATIF